MTDERVIQSDRSTLDTWCSGEFIQRMVMEAFLGLQVGGCDYATSCAGPAYVVHARVVQQTPKDLCGWNWGRVAPMTKAFAERLGMVGTYRAILYPPRPGSPAARRRI